MSEGRLELICGPMFSGKSEELLRRIRRVKIANQKVLVVKPSIDNRYSHNQVVSHIGSNIDAVCIQSSLEILNLLTDEHVVAIDEIQFLDDNIVPVVKELMKSKIRVIASGLDMNYQGNPFGRMPELMAIATKVDKLTSVCNKCMSFEATMTYRPSGFIDSVIDVGGSETYEARCYSCYLIDTSQDSNSQLSLF